MIPVTKDAVKLFHQGIVALAQIERNGIKIDEVYLQKQIKKSIKFIKETEDELKTHKIWKLWRKKFGNNAKLGSKEQLGKIIFDELGHKRSGRKTNNEADKNDFGEFEQVDEPFVKKYFKVEKRKKAYGTYLLGMEREIKDGFMHPIPNLHTAGSYRSSYDRMNIQNFPVRDEEIKEVIRRCIVAPKNFRIGEIDYGGIEVCGSACYHKDPVMIKYIVDPKTDMHRDMAMQCYKLKEKEVTKNIRYNAKNKFVFPEFYGSYFVDCSKALWEAISIMNLETSDGTPLKDHLKKQGIKSLGEKGSNYETGRIETKKGTFMDHIREVEKDFWDNRFRVYKQWKKNWWGEYLELGEFTFLSGFVGRGVYDRKQVCNYPIQGFAFHCLLWSLIQLQNWMNKKKLKSKIIAEIHDSMVLYFHKDEVDHILEKAVQIMTKDIREHWECICVPLTVEAEVAPLGGSWADKVVVEIAA
jgi:DNA polymerase-1